MENAILKKGLAIFYDKHRHTYLRIDSDTWYYEDLEYGTTFTLIDDLNQCKDIETSYQRLIKEKGELCIINPIADTMFE